MDKFNVIVFDFNRQKMEPYNVVPFFIRRYEERVERNLNTFPIPKTYDEFKEFIKSESQYQFWARCEYEIILSSWPPRENYEEKWDVHRQIIMNLDIITKIVMSNLNIKNNE